jgi:hypothetical protein
MNRRAFILFALLVAIFIGGTTYEWVTTKTDRTELIKRVQSIASEGIERIILTPYQLSAENWTIVLSDNEDISTIKASIKNADIQSVMGHSASIGEWTITFVTRTGKKYRFLADVFNHQPNDIFISDTYLIETKEGQWTGSGARRIRLPDSAAWIMKKAPQGRKENS